MNPTETLSIEKLKKLAAYEAPICLTLTMPFIKAGDQQKQNPIRFKNLIREAVKKLQKIGQSGREIEIFLAPLEKLLEEKDFWNKLDKGLIVCASKDFCKFYRLPFTVETNVIVDHHFYLRTVIPHMQQNQYITLFLLNNENPTLVFSADSITEPEIYHPPEPITSFTDFMKVYDSEKSLQFRSQGYEGGIYTTTAGFHGQGTAGDDVLEKKYLKEYLKKLEDWVIDLARRKESREIFFVAESHMEGMYKAVMHKAHPDLRMLMQKNPVSAGIDVWLAYARNQLEDEFNQECQRTLAVYYRLKRKYRRSVEESIPEIVRAAYNHRIDTLLLPDISRDYYWGSFNTKTSEVHKFANGEDVMRSGDELINLAVIQTFLNGGKVLAMPQGEPAHYVALCRW